MASALRRTHGPDALTSFSGKRIVHHPGNVDETSGSSGGRRELWLGFVSAVSSGQQQLPDPAFDRNFASFWMSKISENTRRRNRQRYGKGVLRSVDLWIKGCVKSLAFFLLRRRACFPSPSARAPASQHTILSKNTSSSVLLHTEYR